MASGTEELSIVVRMRDFATRQFQTLSGTIGRWAQTGIQKVGQFAASFLSFRGIIASFASIWAGMKLVDEIAHIENMDNAFANLAKGVGGASEVLKAMQDATHNATCEIELMEAANRAILLGVGKTAKEFGELAGLARRLGAAVGVGTIEAFDDLTNSIAKQNSRALIQIGLVVKAEDAYQKYADTLGIDAKQLNETQKQQAFANAVFEQGRKKVAELGEDTLTLNDRWGQFKESIMDIAQSLMRTAIPALKTFFSDLSELINKSRPMVLNFFASMTEAFATMADTVGPIFDLIGSIFKEMKSWGKYGDYSVWMDDNAKATKAATTTMGDSLRKLAADIRLSAKSIVEDLDDIGRECDVTDLVRKFQETIAEQDATFSLRERQHSKWLDDIGDLKKAEDELAKAIAEEDKQLKKVIDTWQKRTVAGGIDRFFEEAREKAQAFGDMMYESLSQSKDAIVTGISDMLVDITWDFKNAGEILKKFGMDLLKSLQKTWMEATLKMAFNAMIGGAGSLFGVASGGVLPALAPVGHMAWGGIARPPGALFELAEGGHAEAVVPLPDNRSIPVRFQGGGRSVNITIHNHNPSFRTREQERAFTRAEQDQVRAVVLQAMNSSSKFREGMS